mmetsp:Transcript_28226/g.65566  ORF Transcript_28226/g.65566 Transcript_28226/m.65566 type:complete len:300 (+) Transcript_28226:380-1279(+)
MASPAATSAPLPPSSKPIRRASGSPSAPSLTPSLMSFASLQSLGFFGSAEELAFPGSSMALRSSTIASFSSDFTSATFSLTSSRTASEISFRTFSFNSFTSLSGSSVAGLKTFSMSSRSLRFLASVEPKKLLETLSTTVWMPFICCSSCCCTMRPLKSPGPFPASLQSSAISSSCSSPFTSFTTASTSSFTASFASFLSTSLSNAAFTSSRMMPLISRRESWAKSVRPFSRSLIRAPFSILLMLLTSLLFFLLVILTKATAISSTSRLTSTSEKIPTYLCRLFLICAALSLFCKASFTE